MKVNISIKSATIYFTIAGFVAILFFFGTYIFVDRLGVSSLLYIVPAYFLAGIMRLILLSVYWRRVR